ncbi:MAG TPA: hypothetical protein VJR89_28240 [Polyangiales bacterium]|nr:hypothetical protein [Polyangiales bacterium]
MNPIYGAKRMLREREAAERLARHVTRELTAGGIGHWVEVQAVARGFVVFVHRFECAGGEACACAR